MKNDVSLAEYRGFLSKCLVLIRECKMVYAYGHVS